jgi:riboflavin kinase/FMN adenylyltransferase
MVNPMNFSGVVKKNLGRGKKLGFPTANIDAPDDVGDGLYLGLANKSPALVFIGQAKTFDETDRKAEIYILDFEGDLYGQEIEVEIIKKLRENKKFQTERALIEQMWLDEQAARRYFDSL